MAADRPRPVGATNANRGNKRKTGREQESHSDEPADFKKVRRVPFALGKLRSDEP